MYALMAGRRPGGGTVMRGEPAAEAGGIKFPRNVGRGEVPEPHPITGLIAGVAGSWRAVLGARWRRSALV